FFFERGLELVGLQRRTVLDGDMAARAGQAVDAAEQLLLRGSRKIKQQTLSDPRRRLGRIEPTVAQGLWPVLPQIDSYLATPGARLGAVFGEHLTLEVENLRTVQLKNCRPGRPVQAVGARVQSSGQDDY